MEEKPYLQDLFNHMSNEHGLILTQSEMLEILSVCGKEYDTVQFEIGETERQNRMLSAENEKLREALRELVKEAEGYVIPDADKANNSQYDNYIEIDDFKSLVTKAKQLITEEK